jgi:hypothetical protein
MEAQPRDPTAQELIAMSYAGQDMRTNAISGESEWDNVVDDRNTARLKEIVAEIGWPTISKVGAEASSAAWLIAQHSYADPDFMKKCLELMKQADEGDVRPANIAYLEDRLLSMENKPQIYGTQFHKNENGWEPLPIQDPESVDERRAGVGLEPLADYLSRIKETYGP